MKIDQYRLQTAMMECGKSARSIARQAGLQPSELRRIQMDGRCTRGQRNALAAAIDMDPHELGQEDI